MRMKTTSLASAAIIAATALSGCGTEVEPQSASDHSASSRLGTSEGADGEFIERVQGRIDGAIAYASLAEAAGAEPVVLTGSVDGVTAGPTTARPITEDLESSDRTVVVRVRIDRVYKSEGAVLDDGYAYVSFMSGGRMTDADGTPIGDEPQHPTVDAFAEALPDGTRVVIATRPEVPPRAGAEYGTVLDPGTGRPSGEPLLTGDLPPFFSVEKPDGTLTTWRTTYDEAVATLEKASP